MSKRSAAAAGVKGQAEEDASHRQRTRDKTATPPAATSAATAADAATSTSSTEVAATVAASSIAVSHSSSSVRASAFDSLLALRSECDESTLSHGLVARCLGEPYNVWPILKGALQSDQPIDFGLLTDDGPVLALFFLALTGINDETQLAELLSLLQRRLREWRPRPDSSPDRIPVRRSLFRFLCFYTIPARLMTAQIHVIEQIAATLMALGADMTALGPDTRNTIAMIIARKVGGQTLLARMLQTPCSGVWSSAAMLTMVWHRNNKDKSLLGLLRESPAPHDAVWKSNIAHVKSIRRFWLSDVKPALTAVLVSECSLVTDVAHICLDYIDGVDRTNISSVPEFDADDDDESDSSESDSSESDSSDEG